MLQFLVPMWLVVLLPVLGMVLWLHRKKAVDVPLIHFGAIRFIQSIQAQQRASHTLSNRWLLFLRLLMMTLLLAAFASPVWQVADQRSDDGATALILDATASMCRKIGKENAWQRARQQAIAWLTAHPQESVMVYVLKDELTPLLNEPTLNHAYLAQQIRQQDVSFAQGHFDSLMQLPETIPIGKLLLFTDAQASGFPHDPQSWLHMVAERACEIHDVMPEPINNISITDVRCVDRSVAGQHQVLIECTISNSSARRVQVPLDVMLLGTRLAGQAEVDLAPGTEQSKSITIPLDTPDALHAQLRLNVVDELDWDNWVDVILPAQIQPAVRTLGTPQLTRPLQRLFTSHHYQTLPGPRGKDTLLIASPENTAENSLIDEHLQQNGTVMWLLHDDASVGAFAQYARAHFPDTMPGLWESRQTLVPDFWQWTWGQSTWLDVFKQGYEVPLTKMISSKVLIWDRIGADDDHSTWEIMAKHGGQPVVMYRWVEGSVLLVIVMPTDDWVERFKNPAMLGLLLHLGDYALHMPYQLLSAYPGNPQNVDYLWEPMVNQAARLVHPFNGKVYSQPWDGKPICLTEPGVYTLKDILEPLRNLAQTTAGVHRREVDLNKIDTAAYSKPGEYSPSTNSKEPLQLWPWMLLMVLLLATVEAVYAHQLHERSVVDG